MPVLGKSVGIENINKFYLEQALLAYSIGKSDSYLEKCRKINKILNQAVKEELKSRRYKKRIDLTNEDYQEIFG